MAMTDGEKKIVELFVQLGFKKKFSWRDEENHVLVLLLQYERPFVVYEGQETSVRFPLGNWSEMVVSAEGKTSAEIKTAVLGVFPGAVSQGAGRFQVPQEIELDPNKIQYLLHYPCQGGSGPSPTMLVVE